MQKKYKRSLVFISFLLIVCGLLGVAYLFYDKVLNNETQVVVVGDLSINFIDGQKITQDGTYAFSITNNSQKDVYYQITYDELILFDENVSFDITSNEADINISNSKLNKDNPVLVDNILIAANETQNFAFTINNDSKTTFKLNINKIEDSEEYFYMTILANNTVKESSTTKVAEEIATTDEGLIEDIDDYGTTYYYRGNVTNNYVEFAGLTWRIVRINGNGTVQLILDDLASELSNYNTDTSAYENYEKSNINTNLTSYYETNLKEYDSYITNTKYCVETGHTTSGNNKIYNAYTRLVTNKIPTFNCLGSSYSSKIGLLTADEVALAGANFENENKTYYLYNSEFENSWWTSSLAKTDNGEFYPFSVDTSGKIISSTSGTLYRGLRPTINLIKKVIVTGDGSKSNPYKVVS